MTTIGYLVPNWPTQTHAFFWREIEAIRATGGVVRLYSTSRPAVDACRHEFAPDARRQTHYLHPPHILGALALLATSPRRLVAALAYVLRLRDARVLDRLQVLAMLGSAADLAAHTARHGITHVHAHSCGNSAHLLALASRLGKLRYSLTLHGDLEVYGGDHRAKMQGARFVAAVTRPLQAQVTAISALTPDRVPLIPMGVDTTAFTAAARPACAGVLHLVTVARLNPTKGHRFVLAAIRQAVARGLDVHYSVAGDGPAYAAIMADIAAYGLGDRVTLLGSLGERAILGLLRRADAFVLASIGLGEAAPVSVMEAMSCGLPVICSRIGGTTDMMTHGVDGWLVDQADVDGLAAAIEALARDVELRERLGTAARVRAVEAFDHRIMADRLLAAIAGSVAGGSSPADAPARSASPRSAGPRSASHCPASHCPVGPAAIQSVSAR